MCWYGEVANPDKSTTVIQLMQFLGKSMKEQSTLTLAHQKKVTLILCARAGKDSEDKTLGAPVSSIYRYIYTHTYIKSEVFSSTW